MQDFGFEVMEENVSCIGVVIGFGIGGFGLIEENYSLLVKGGLCKISLFFVLLMIVNMVVGYLIIMYGLCGLSIFIVIVCILGVYNIGYVVCIIVYGDVDVMVVGGVEKVSMLLGVGGFGVVCVLLICNDNLQVVSCLWDKECDGFVLGDGVGMLVFEEYEYVKVCGVKIYVEIVGFGMSSDVYYMMLLLENGVGVVLVMVNVLCDVVIEFVQIGYVNVYGMLMFVGDKVEMQVVKLVFGDVVS